MAGSQNRGPTVRVSLARADATQPAVNQAFDMAPRDGTVVLAGINGGREMTGFSPDTCHKASDREEARTPQWTSPSAHRSA